MATQLNAHGLTCARIPSLKVGYSTTSSDSTQNLEFRASLVHWNTFEREVRQVFDGIRWDTQTEILAYAPPPNGGTGPNHTCNEQLFCGDEHSTVARFNQNVGHVMTSVFQSLGFRARFGDFKTCCDTTINNKVPDIVLLGDQGSLRVVGEAKTPWMHTLDNFSDQEDTRSTFGQISRYMFTSKAKYGFLTTYDQTIFFMQAPHPHEDKKEKHWALWHSNVIEHRTSSTTVPPRSDFTAYRGKVSLRECFLFLGMKTSGGSPKCANPMKEENWVGPLSTTKYNDSDYISPSSSSSSSASSVSSTSSSGGPSDSERGRSRPQPTLSVAGRSQPSRSPRPPVQPTLPGTQGRSQPSRYPQPPTQPAVSVTGRSQPSRSPQPPAQAQPPSRTVPTTRSQSRAMRDLEDRTRTLGLSDSRQTRPTQTSSRDVVTVYHNGATYYYIEGGRQYAVQLHADGDRYYFMQGSVRRYVRYEGKR
ncbi:hypothetical protein BO78DRAFT_400399 [Aspergillus sclerotiicarbonarius CBS 121057]|uniref:Uncharacterized protein n=1 Tax=Aspergillus sclerotiicarbonarius (strain CBS 121057 / IBT 28362) TaxID=1448318 RepID=A0A319EP92_ASPSB|nr:hypothetical protein BO78DRAFT_400399 [Aspergillus sclerotiicarbonarius CBS 121057]